MMAATSGRTGMASSRFGFMRGSALQRVQVVDVDAAPFAEQHDQDGEADGGLRGGHGEHEEHEDLSADVSQVARERDEVEVRREQQQLHAHQQQDDVLAVEEDARNRYGEQDAG